MNAEKNVDLGSKGKLKKLAGADDQVRSPRCFNSTPNSQDSLSLLRFQAMADHKPWKKHAMRVTLSEKALQYIICPRDLNSMDVWHDAFTCVP